MRLPKPVVKATVSTFSRLVLRPSVPVSFQRKAYEALSFPGPLPDGVSEARGELGGRPVLTLTPAGARGTVLWLHGGAFITGSPRTHRSFGAALAASSGATVHLLDYRLAPEHRHPAAVEDALAALAELSGPLVLGGDSAGGGLTLLSLLAGARVDGVALVSPVVDLTLSSADAYPGRDPVVSHGWSHQGTGAMFGADPAARPDVLGADLSGFLPTVVHVSELERLREEGKLLAGLLPSCELTVLPGLWHDVHLQAGLLREADDAVSALGRSVRRLLDR